MSLSDHHAMKLIIWAKRQPKVKSLTVFGSHAKGTAGPARDIDVALELVGDEGEALGAFIPESEGWRKQLSEFVGREVDLCLGGEAAGPEVRQGLEEASILVYTRGAKPDF